MSRHLTRHQRHVLECDCRPDLLASVIDTTSCVPGLGKLAARMLLEAAASDGCGHGRSQADTSKQKADLPASAARRPLCRPACLAEGISQMSEEKQPVKLLASSRGISCFSPQPRDRDAASSQLPRCFLQGLPPCPIHIPAAIDSHNKCPRQLLLPLPRSQYQRKSHLSHIPDARRLRSHGSAQFPAVRHTH